MKLKFKDILKRIDAKFIQQLLVRGNITFHDYIDGFTIRDLYVSSYAKSQIRCFMQILRTVRATCIAEDITSSIALDSVPEVQAFLEALEGLDKGRAVEKVVGFIEQLQYIADILEYSHEYVSNISGTTDIYIYNSCFESRDCAKDEGIIPFVKGPLSLSVKSSYINGLEIPYNLCKIDREHLMWTYSSRFSCTIRDSICDINLTNGVGIDYDLFDNKYRQAQNINLSNSCVFLSGDNTNLLTPIYSLCMHAKTGDSSEAVKNINIFVHSDNPDLPKLESIKGKEVAGYKIVSIIKIPPQVPLGGVDTFTTAIPVNLKLRHSTLHVNTTEFSVSIAKNNRESNYLLDNILTALEDKMSGVDIDRSTFISSGGKLSTREDISNSFFLIIGEIINKGISFNYFRSFTIDKLILREADLRSQEGVKYGDTLSLLEECDKLQISPYTLKS